jgi:predicted anti-sigma-YlaC factor YlaD
MDCKTIETLLQGFIDGEVTSEERDQVLLHLDTCSSCQKELERSKRIQELFQAEEELPSGFRENLYVRIREEESVKDKRRRLIPLPAMNFQLLWIGGMAVILIFVSLFFMRMGTTIKGTPEELSRIHVVTPVRDGVISGKEMDICAAFYPSIQKKTSVQLWIDDEDVTQNAEISGDFILITKNLKEGYHQVTVKLEGEEGLLLEELSWTFYTL